MTYCRNQCAESTIEKSVLFIWQEIAERNAELKIRSLDDKSQD